MHTKVIIPTFVTASMQGAITEVPGICTTNEEVHISILSMTIVSVEVLSF